MANINAPNGMSPVRYLNGAAWNQQANLYCIPADNTDIFGIGDIMLSLIGADANGVPNITKAVDTSVPRGVLVGVDPVLTSGLSLVGSPLSLETIAIPSVKAHPYYVYVVDDPKVIFEIQGNNSTSTTAAGTITANAKPVVANPATGSPYSGTTLAVSTVATTNTFMLKILGLTRRPGADFTAYTRFQVIFNVHEFNGSTTGFAP